MSRTSCPRNAPFLSTAAALALLLLAGLAMPACAGQEQAAATKASEPGAVAEIDGQPITMAELEQSVAGQLAQLDKQRRELLEQNLGRLIEEKLLEREALARGVTKEALTATEISAKVQPVTDADVDAWYEANKARLGGRAKESIAPQIQQFLANERGTEARAGFLSSLREKYKVRILLEPHRVKVAATGPAKGPAGAPITIVEFSEFECPFCARVNPTLDQVRATYGDKVRIVFRHLPLPMHANAFKASEASLCADEQGKFWEMHDAMFADQRNLGVDALKAKAASIGLDAARFDECLDSGRHAAQVQADLAEGQQVGANGTPTFFINGRLLSGAQPFEAFKELIDDELARR
ncbi:MAG: DsbA family protein [Thermoanaerobaculia bacterium]|nr:DsbA family protein [Thermoanaerobaculia bacterium]